MQCSNTTQCSEQTDTHRDENEMMTCRSLGVSCRRASEALVAGGQLRVDDRTHYEGSTAQQQAERDEMQ
jgi:hypothetical protein